MKNNSKALSHKKKYDEAAKVLAETFGCSDSYIRRVIRDTRSEKHKGERAQAIRKAYLHYKVEKIKALRPFAKFRKAA